MDDEGRLYHVDVRRVTQARNGNGMVTGQNHNFHSNLTNLIQTCCKNGKED